VIITPTGARLDGVRVLALEDRPDHLALITRMLTEAGARVSGVTSAQEAFDDVHSNPPDLLIVAFTAEANSSKRDEAIRQGVEYYVTKPDFARLMHVVAHAAAR
jgi:CheY-like chemotaxis protein